MQCSHIKENGTQCQRRTKTGFTVCNLHGGNAPSAKHAAERALAFARMPAVEALLAIVEQFNETTCATCGYPSGDTDAQRAVIQASRAILDRTGMGPHSILEVKQSDGELNLAHMTDEERAEAMHLVARLKALKARIRARLNPGEALGVVPVPMPEQNM